MLKKADNQKQELLVSIAYDSYEKEIATITRLGEDKIRILDKAKPAYDLLKEFDTFEEQKTYASKYKEALTAVTNAEKSLVELQKSVDIAEKNKDNLLKEYPVLLLKVTEQVGVYEWIGKIFNVDAGFVQFMLSVIPAISLDFIGTLGLYVYFFMRRKDEQSSDHAV
jgi:hypothetical protein